MAQNFDIWYVTLPSGTLPSLRKFGYVVKMASSWMSQILH